MIWITLQPVSAQAALLYISRAVFLSSSAWTTFRRLTLPMLSQTIFSLVIINMPGSFQVFGTIAIMTEGGPAISSWLCRF